MTLIWIDVYTAKQARIASILYDSLKKLSIDVFITCRNYDFIKQTLNVYNVPYVCIGEYGLTLRDKLIKGFERALKLIEILPEFDLLISFPIPESHRIAWGLNKPIITLTDTIHSYYVNKLTLPLSKYVVVPSAIPIKEFRKFIPEEELNKVITFNGVFEIMWIKNYKPNAKILEELNLKPYEYIVFRFEEAKASYYKFGDKFLMIEKLIRLILSYGYKIVIFPRYDYQIEFLKSKFSDLVDKELIIPKFSAINVLDFSYYSRFVITGGSTFALEASLLGIPSISYYPHVFYIDEFLIRCGFPLIRCFNENECIEIVKTFLKENVKRIETEKLLKNLEDPVNVIIEKVKEILEQK